MGIDLRDRETLRFGFSVNFWHWGAIVEVVRRLQVIPAESVDRMREQFVPGAGLSCEEARCVAAAIRRDLLPCVQEGERVLLDGRITTEPDDGVLHRVDFEKNYSTNRGVLESFAEYCESCSGFDVL